MPTIFTFRAYRIMDFTNDHARAHVHVVGPDGHAKFVLGKTPVDVSLIEVDGIAKRSLRNIVIAVIDRFDECMEAWEKVHGNQGTS